MYSILILILIVYTDVCNNSFSFIQMNQPISNGPTVEQSIQPVHQPNAISHHPMLDPIQERQKEIPRIVEIHLEKLTVICSICLEEYLKEDMQSISTCSHVFCKGCLMQHIQQGLSTFTKITCPMELCNQEMTKNDPIFMQLTAEDRIKFNKMQRHYQILKNPKLKVCKKQNCQGTIDVSTADINNMHNSTCICPVCKTQHCLKCYQLAHDGACQKNLARNLQLNKKYRQCRQCGQVIEKVEGCTHMTCTCGHYFCYSCGQPLEGEHKCKIPQQLNCMQKIRWEVQHIQLWYETNCFNFLKILVFFQPDPKTNIILRLFWILIYTTFIYPFTIILGVFAILLCIACLLAVFIIFAALLPFLTVCGMNVDLNIGRNLKECTGVCLGFIIVLLLYPVFFLINLFQFICCVICANTANLQQFCGVFLALFTGLRNIILMPCLMLTNNEEFYEREGNNFISK